LWLRPHPGGMPAISPGCRTRGSGRRKRSTPEGLQPANGLDLGGRLNRREHREHRGLRVGQFAEKRQKNPNHFRSQPDQAAPPFFGFFCFFRLPDFLLFQRGDSPKRTKRDKRTRAISAPNLTRQGPLFSASFVSFGYPISSCFSGAIRRKERKETKEPSGSVQNTRFLHSSRLRRFACEFPLK
jgi:hypothetical protein